MAAMIAFHLGRAQRRELHWVKFQRDHLHDDKGITPTTALHELARNLGLALPPGLNGTSLARSIVERLRARPYIVGTRQRA